MEADKPGREYHFWMQRLGNSLHQVGMSIQGDIVQYSNCLVPGFVQLFKLTIEEVVETGGVEAACIDFVEVQNYIRITEVKFLIQGVYFPNELSSFSGDVNSH